MARPQRINGLSIRRNGHRRYAINVLCTDLEYATIQRVAAQDGLTIADFIRRSINGYLLDMGDDMPLLRESVTGDVDRPRLRL